MKKHDNVQCLLAYTEMMLLPFKKNEPFTIRDKCNNRKYYVQESKLEFVCVLKHNRGRSKCTTRRSNSVGRSSNVERVG